MDKMPLLFVLSMSLGPKPVSGQVVRETTIEKEIEQFINSGMKANENQLTLLIPFDLMGGRISRLRNSDYKDALLIAWKEFTIEYNVKKAHKALEKAKIIRRKQLY